MSTITDLVFGNVLTIDDAAIAVSRSTQKNRSIGLHQKSHARCILPTFCDKQFDIFYSIALNVCKVH